MARRPSAEDGWAVLQTLIVAAIVAAVVAVAVPLATSGARAAHLEQNAATLKLELASYLAQGLDPTYVAGGGESGGADSGNGGADSRNAAAVFTRALRGPRGHSAYYVNPFDGSRAVVCSRRLPPLAEGGPPAVWITDDQRYAYAAYRPSAQNTARLRGTLVVAFLLHDGRTSGVDVYYVERDGQRSGTVGLLAL